MTRTLIPALACALTVAVRAITIPGAHNGSDGPLNITSNTEIDLSQAVDGSWDQNNAANAGKGVYDPNKWAVVFKYSSVNVASGATVTFKNHASRAPVVWLVNGDVTIAGTVSLNGQNAATPPALAEGGPGGGRGGSGYYGPGVAGASGMGVGSAVGFNGGGAYGSTLNGASITYGNPSLVPLLGGSGGSGDDLSQNTGGGGGGGGAMLLACSGTFSCTGQLRSNGGTGAFVGSASWIYDRSGGGGSGGGIRIVCDSSNGQGTLNAIGALQAAGLGRIRLERVSNTASYTVAPAPSIVPLAPGATALLWPPDGAPEVRIVSVGNVETPIDPRAGFGSEGADVALPQTSSTQAVIYTKNVEQAATVKVRVTPRSNAAATVVTATLQSVLGTDPLEILWTATLPVNTGYSALQVHVVRP